MRGAVHLFQGTADEPGDAWVSAQSLRASNGTLRAFFLLVLEPKKQAHRQVHMHAHTTVDTGHTHVHTPVLTHATQMCTHLYRRATHMYTHLYGHGPHMYTHLYRHRQKQEFRGKGCTFSCLTK